MSLINDALKKAARQRAEEQADLSTLMPGGSGSRASRGASPVGKQTIVVIAGAAVALAVVSAVITGYLMTGKSEPKPVEAMPVAAPAAPRTHPVPEATQLVPAIFTITVPKLIAAAPTPTPAPTEAPVVIARPTPTPTPAPVVAVQTAAPVPVAAAPQSHAEQVQAYVDGLHVSGARAAGADSKALIDGHVYKVNDLLDRALGLRLTNVDADQLTFVDATGATYLKSY